MSPLLLRSRGVDVVAPVPFVLVGGATFAIRGPMGLWREHVALLNMRMSSTPDRPVQPTVFVRPDQAEDTAAHLLKVDAAGPEADLMAWVEAGAYGFTGAEVLHVVQVVSGPDGLWVEPSPAVVVSEVKLIEGVPTVMPEVVTAETVTGQGGVL